MENNMIIDGFEKLLQNMVTGENIRTIEAEGAGGNAAKALWAAIAESGYLDALVDEASGGFGLSVAEVQPLWSLLGQYGVPLPVGETMIARALLAAEGGTPPEGAIVLASGKNGARMRLPNALVADYLLAAVDGQLRLQRLDGAAEPSGIYASLAGTIRLGGGEAMGGEKRCGDAAGLLPQLAVLRASLIAGAAARLTQMTADYANDRVQFGKPIGKQQVLQQNLAVMAEDMVACRIAAQMGAAGAWPPSQAAAAFAKSITSSAVMRMAATAHAVHGAIGISAESDVQLFTRRLAEWRLADGSESYWNRLLGAERLASADAAADAVQFVRSA